MENTVILYDNDSMEIKEVLEAINRIIPNSKLNHINNKLNIEDYSNIVVTISMEYEDNFNLYQYLRDYNIDFTNKKLIIIYIGSIKEDIMEFINEIKVITKKSDLYYCFINLNYRKYENTINAANNINKYIETNKRSKKRSIK